MSTRSWDYEVFPLNETKHPFRTEQYCTQCGFGKGDLPEYSAHYLYVTGRRGRITRRNIRLCRTHAQVFCEKHGLELPEDGHGA